MKRKAAYAIFLLAIMALLKIKIYAAKEISGQITDSLTGLPVKGAYLVATWSLQGGVHGESRGILKILESQTNEQGKFLFQAWGPELTTAGYLSAGDPAIFVYADSYKTVTLSNKSLNPVYRLFANSDWNGHEIKIEKFSGSRADYLKHLSSGMPSYFEEILRSDVCAWKYFPSTKNAISEIGYESEKINLSNLSQLAEKIKTNAYCY